MAKTENLIEMFMRRWLLFDGVSYWLSLSHLSHEEEPELNEEAVEIFHFIVFSVVLCF